MGAELKILEVDANKDQIITEIFKNGYNLSDFEIKKQLIQSSLNYNNLPEEVLFSAIGFVMSAKIIRK